MSIEYAVDVCLTRDNRLWSAQSDEAPFLNGLSNSSPALLASEVILQLEAAYAGDRTDVTMKLRLNALAAQKEGEHHDSSAALQPHCNPSGEGCAHPDRAGNARDAAGDLRESELQGNSKVTRLFAAHGHLPPGEHLQEDGGAHQS